MLHKSAKHISHNIRKTEYFLAADTQCKGKMHSGAGHFLLFRHDSATTNGSLKPRPCECVRKSTWLHDCSCFSILWSCLYNPPSPGEQEGGKGKKSGKDRELEGGKQSTVGMVGRGRGG